MVFDMVIVGAGLAGSCAALHLSGEGSVVVLDEREPATGASAINAGLINPFMSRRARPAWNMEAALEAFEHTLSLVGHPGLVTRGLLRPAFDENEAAHFRESALRYPGHARWLSPEEVRYAYPFLQVPHGALSVPDGGAVALPRFVRAMLEAAEARGADVRECHRLLGWHEEAGEAVLDVEHRGAVVRLRARRVLLALGAGYAHFPELTALRLHAVKGQAVTVARPSSFSGLPALAGRGYVASIGRRLVLGSTFEHTYRHPDPDPAQSNAIIDKVSRMLPLLRDAEVLEAQAGIRVTVPGTRLPMVGPLPGHRRIWLFTGLGSKGLMTAPLLSTRLSGFLHDADLIPRDVRVRSR